MTLHALQDFPEDGLIALRRGRMVWPSWASIDLVDVLANRILAKMIVASNVFWTDSTFLSYFLNLPESAHQAAGELMYEPHLPCGCSVST